jgi:hypothetical protein
MTRLSKKLNILIRGVQGVYLKPLFLGIGDFKVELPHPIEHPLG